MTSTVNYGQPSYNIPVLQGQPYLFTIEWYKFITSLVQTVNNNTPSGDTAADAEGLAVLISQLMDPTATIALNAAKSAATGVNDAESLALLAHQVTDPVAAQALRRSSDAALLAIASLGDPLATKAQRDASGAQELAVLLASAEVLVARAQRAADDAQRLAVVLAAGTPAAVTLNLGGGPTANRPPKPPLYGTYFDTTLGYPIWVSQVTPSVKWVNASGYGPV